MAFNQEENTSPEALSNFRFGGGILPYSRIVRVEIDYQSGFVDTLIYSYMSRAARDVNPDDGFPSRFGTSISDEEMQSIDVGDVRAAVYPIIERMLVNQARSESRDEANLTEGATNGNDERVS